MAEKLAELEEQSKSFVDFAAKIGGLDLSQSVEKLRELNEKTAQRLKGDFVFVGSKEERVIAATDGGSSYEIPVTVLRPELQAGQDYNKILIYFHGGGWVWGSRNTHMKFCELIASSCRCVVVNVEYRLSPENKFPACYVDAQAVVNWCQSNKKLLASNELALIGVAGDSAGANISASVCHIVKGVDYQVLIYPSFTMSVKNLYPSYHMYGEGYLLTKQMMVWFRNHFLTSQEDAEDVRGSPMNRTDFAGLPPALLVVTECDPLADQSPDYQSKLEKAGVRTELVILKGTVRGFVTKPGLFKTATDKTLTSIADFISNLEE